MLAQIKYHTIFSFFTFTVLTLYCYYSFSQTPANDPHWQLLWEDNFDNFDQNRWLKAQYCDHWSRSQLFTPDNVDVDGFGHLVITANNNTMDCPVNPPPNYCACGNCSGTYYYTSGMVETSVPSYVQYGYIEAEIKLPYGNGLIPSFWTWINIPSYQEIDIFEMLPGKEEYCGRDYSQRFIHTNNIMSSSIHFDQPTADECNDPYNYNYISSINDYSKWHTYAIEWSPSRIIWYVDNYPVRYFQNSKIIDPTRIIFWLAINPYVTINCNFPESLLVNYVRVYQLKKDCDDFINSTNYDFTSYNNMEKNFIKIGQGGGNNSLSVGQNLILRSSQFIEIDGEFNVPYGASLYMDVSKDCSNDIYHNCTQTFNPCTYDFSNYDNSIKKFIDLGGITCPQTITPTSNSIYLKATDRIILKKGISISSIQGKSVHLKIVSCNE